MNEHDQKFICLQEWIRSRIVAEIKNDGGCVNIPCSMTRAYVKNLKGASKDVFENYTRAVSRYGVYLFEGETPVGWIGSADWELLLNYSQELSFLASNEHGRSVLANNSKDFVRLKSLINQRYNADYFEGLFHVLYEGCNCCVAVRKSVPGMGCNLDVFTSRYYSRSRDRGLFPVSVPVIMGLRGGHWDIVGSSDDDTIINALDWCLDAARGLEIEYVQLEGQS